MARKSDADLPESREHGGMSLVTGLAIAAGTAALVYGWRSAVSGGKPDAQTDPIARRDMPETTGATVTIAASPAELYGRWRRYEDFAAFMPTVESVNQRSGDDSVSDWTIIGPGGERTELVSQIVEDVPDQRIGWEATGPLAAHAGVVTFDESPRGTQVRLELTLDPPLGRIGAIAGNLIGKPAGTSPRQQARQALKRLKQLVETGEISRNSADDQAAGAMA